MNCFNKIKVYLLPISVFMNVKLDAEQLSGYAFPQDIIQRDTILNLLITVIRLAAMEERHRVRGGSWKRGGGGGGGGHDNDNAGGEHRGRGRGGNANHRGRGKRDHYRGRGRGGNAGAASFPRRVSSVGSFCGRFVAQPINIKCLLEVCTVLYSSDSHIS